MIEFLNSTLVIAWADASAWRSIMVVLLGPVGGQLGPFLGRDAGGDLREFVPDRLMLRGWLGLTCRWLLRLGCPASTF